jgi:phosphoribosylformylglycinamidine synthase
MKQVNVYVALKKDILDPQGLVIKQTLETMNYKGIREVRVGKYINITFDNDVSEETLHEICNRVLSNPVIEDYKIEG